jgi:hypothetical protein
MIFINVVVKSPYDFFSKEYGNHSVILTDTDLRNIKDVRDALGEATEFEYLVKNYDLGDFSILNLFSVDFVDRILSFNSTDTV